MISHKYKFIFIHIRKTGGTSIECIFKKNVGGAFENGRAVQYKHENAERMKKLFPEEWDKYFKFTIVRNPFDLLVSRYFWSRDEQHLKSFKERSFSQFLLDVNKNNLPIKWTIPTCQYDQITIGGKSGMEYIGKFENLQEDFNIICNKIGIPQQVIPHKNKSKHKHYTEYYDEETRQIVAELYAKDIDYFGYEFGQ